MATPKDPQLKNLFRIDIAARKGKHETHGWQFKAMREGEQQTKFFADGVFGSRELSLVAAKTYRDERLLLIGDYVGQYISDTLPSSNTSGILGVHRSESIRQDLSIEEVWQCHSPTLGGTKRGYRSFRIASHGERGALYKAVEARMESISELIGKPEYASSQAAIRRLIDQYLDILVYLESADETEAAYILSVVNSKQVTSTEKQQIIAGRVGQGTFRARLERLWSGRCSVTGSSSLLNASHIKPWATSNDAERLDPFNGFLLSPVYDKAFDQGLITFEDSGAIRISSRLLPDARALSLSNSARIKSVHPLSRPYLEYHRTYVYDDA